jgi:hypothetical protein
VQTNNPPILLASLFLRNLPRLRRWLENGSFDASLTTSRAGQMMISHLNGSFRAIAARKTDSLTSSRTTNVPTAPMLTTPNFTNCFAISAGWHRFVPPTFTARRNTTHRIRAEVSQLFVD